MSDTTTHHGRCHCGAVRYSVELALGEVLACNCSMCGKSGTLLSFVPASAFHLEQGADDLVSYHFNKRVIDHTFCKHCGIKSFARGVMPDGSAMIAVNARCLDDVDVAALKVKHVDGKHF